MDNYLTPNKELAAYKKIYDGTDKIFKCISSSQTEEQLETCSNMLANLRNMMFCLYGIPKDGKLKQSFLQKLGFNKNEWEFKDTLVCIMENETALISEEIAKRRKEIIQC